MLRMTDSRWVPSPKHVILNSVDHEAIQQLILPARILRYAQDDEPPGGSVPQTCHPNAVKDHELNTVALTNNGILRYAQDDRLR